MDVTLKIHVEASEAGAPIWWVESPELPGFTASADTLAELRAAIADVLVEFGPELTESASQPGDSITVTSEQLIPVDAPATATPATRIRAEGEIELRRPSPVQVLIPA